MAQSDGTSGYFGDLPYFGPVEVSLLYSVLHSSRVHKLQEKMMHFCRDLNFFMNLDSRLGSKISEVNGSNKKLSCLPSLNKNTSSRSFSSAASNNILICYTGSRYYWESRWEEVNLDSNGIDRVWTECLRFIFDDRIEAPKFLIPNCDLILNDGDRAYLFSILMTGISSIIHYFEALPKFQEKVRQISLGLLILDTVSGKVSGDAISLYIANRHGLSAGTTNYGSFSVAYEELIKDATIINADNLSEWREEIKSITIDWFEELCDQEGTSSEEMKSPVILLILPDKRESLVIQAKILDSYTSVPTRIVHAASIKEDLSLFSSHQPIIVCCSSSWIHQQKMTNKADRIIEMLNVKRVVHCGYVEYGQNISEELLSTLSFLPGYCLEGGLALVQHETVFYETSNEECSSNITLDQVYLPDAILLLFRRFLSKYSPETQQPRLHLPESIFINSSGCETFRKVLKFMEMTGSIKIIHESNEIELTSVGRFLSYSFRYLDGYNYEKKLSPQDAKAILWGFTLRQSNEIILKIIQDNHIRCDWVPLAVRKFCECHRIGFDSSTELDNYSLINHLASYGLKRPTEFNRLHFILSLPSGRRQKVQNHYLRPPPTVCRGWQSDGNVDESASVQTYCYPAASVFCELSEALISSQEKPIQCPLELSYPLLVVHSVLHISLHNNCIFLESIDNDAHPVPMPLDILRLHTIKSLLYSEGKWSTGGWIDSNGNCCTLIPSNASLLDFMRYKGSGPLVAVVSSTTAGRKRNRENERGEKPDAVETNSTGFTGKMPRSESEKTIILEFIDLVANLGRQKAEQKFRGKRGFAFLDSTNDLHQYYLYLIEKGGKGSS